MLELTALETWHAGFALGPVDLRVDEEVLTVLGPSGSGKSTLLLTVAGIVEPAAGRILLDGRDLVGRPPEARGTGLVFQDGALFPHMTARENVSYAATDDGRVAELASLLEITDVLDRRPDALSGGERQRVALARTLAADPDALLLDEPLSSLDAPIRRRLRLELHDLFAELTIPVVYVTHDQRTASALGDRIAVLRDGTVEQVGPAETVLARPETPFVARFTGSENVFEATVRDVDGEELVLAVAGGQIRARTPGKRSEGHGGTAAGETVVVTIHPSRLKLVALDTHPGAEGTMIRGSVTRIVNEGDQYRVVVLLSEGQETGTVASEPGTENLQLTVTTPPPTVDQLELRVGDAVALSVAPADVHLLE